MKIYVWGTGCGASELQEYGVDPKDIYAFIDSFPSGPEFMGRPVLLPEDVRCVIPILRFCCALPRMRI